MTSLMGSILGCLLLSASGGVSQEQPMAASLIQLIATPEKFEGRLISVRGFLVVLGGEHDIVGYTLYLNQEDDENEVGNQIDVVPNDQMKKDREKIDRMYVILTSTVHGVRAADGTSFAVVRDIRECRPWSDPKHPILLKAESDRKNQ
jgi:hypothetical protein